VNPASWARLGFAAVAAVVIQVSVLDNVTLIGAHPDAMIVLAAAGGVVAGPARGAMIGFVAGCLADLTVSLPFGFSPLTFVLVGYGAPYLVRAASGRDLPTAELATTVVAAAAGTVLYALLAAAVGQPAMLGVAVARAVVIVAAGALVFGLLVLRVVRWVLAPSFTSIGGIGAG
jgi:cell shape-determining protein MreD